MKAYMEGPNATSPDHTFLLNFRGSLTEKANKEAKTPLHYMKYCQILLFKY